MTEPISVNNKPLDRGLDLVNSVRKGSSVTHSERDSFAGIESISVDTSEVGFRKLQQMVADLQPSDVSANCDLAVGVAHLALASGEGIRAIEYLVDAAFAQVREMNTDGAVSLFRQARNLFAAAVPVERLSQAVASAEKALLLEQNQFRQQIESLGGSETCPRVIVLADSLGLPRLTAGHDGTDVNETYSALISQNLNATGTTKVTSFCRRYNTIQNVVSNLASNKNEIKGAAILVHVGLNDCASRIFLEHERHALTLLPLSLQQRILEFARIYRVPIIAGNPDHSYVPLETFREGLVQACKYARAFGADYISLATIVQPPISFEKRTPHMRWNFTRYNMAIYETAKQFGAGIIDIDRLCWENGTQETLISDGMHLARRGHQLMATAFVDEWKTKRRVN